MSHTWVRSSIDDGLPENAIYAGFDTDANVMFVGRTRFKQDKIPCNVVPKKKAAYVSYNGKAERVHDYEVLTGNSKSFEWISTSGRNIPKNALAVGSQSNGVVLYMGRAHFRGGLISGKVHSDHGCLYVPHFKVEHTIKEYEILVRVDPTAESSIWSDPRIYQIPDHMQLGLH